MMRSKVFCCAVLRLDFLALDPFDALYAEKEAARGMAKPFVRHQCILRRCVRYLSLFPR